MSYHMLSYTHSDPLYESLKGTVDLERGSPADSIGRLVDGQVDAAMVSLISFLEHRDSLKLLPSANIHALSTTGSTLLISEGEMLRKKMEIAVTAATRTTSFYLSLILKKMKIEFNFIQAESQDADSLLSESGYSLVIGDEALKVYGSQHRILLDVGYEFSRLYSRLPVYAVTVASIDYKGPIVEEINSAMASYRNYTDQCAEKASQRLGVKKSIMDWYYELIKYNYDGTVQRTIDFVTKSI